MAVSRIQVLLSFLVMGIAYRYYGRNFKSKNIPINCNPKKYDYLSLTLQWPMSFCNNGGVTCTSPIPNHFIVHGLWPKLFNGRSTTCNSAIFKLNYAQLDSSELNYMRKYWPNLNSNVNSRANNYREWLWDHEYQRHGSCFMPFQTQPSLYFQKTVEMSQYIGSVTKKLLHPGRIQPDNHVYPLRQIEKAIFGHLKFIPRLRCNSARGIQLYDQLYEIEFCFTKNWAQINCSNYFGDFRNSKCGNSWVRFPQS